MWIAEMVHLRSPIQAIAATVESTHAAATETPTGKDQGHAGRRINPRFLRTGVP